MNISIWVKDLIEIQKWLSGLEGEDKIRQRLNQKKIPFFQVDLIFFDDNRYKIAEIKHQEPFDPPPFKGHGLPRWQVEARLEFYYKTGVEPFLFILDKIDKNIYYQSFIILENGKYYDTNGEKPRRIYPIENFKIWT